MILLLVQLTICFFGLAASAAGGPVILLLVQLTDFSGFYSARCMGCGAHWARCARHGDDKLMTLLLMQLTIRDLVASATDDLFLVLLLVQLKDLWSCCWCN